MYRKCRRELLGAQVLPLLAASLVFLGGCAGGQLAKVGGTNELPTDLPKDLQQKFEIRDASTPAAEAKLTEMVTPVSQGKKGKKKKKRAKKTAVKEELATAAPPAVPFVYPNRRPAKDPIWVGESQQFDISYLGVYAGKFTLKVEPLKVVANRKVYHVHGTAISASVFSLFYRLNDVVETFIDYEGIFSHRFHIMLDESKQTRDAIELNDSEKKQTYYWNRWNRSDAPYVETKEFFPIDSFSQDSLSALYYLRTVPLPDGASVVVPVINEGKTWEAIVHVLRREMVDSPMGKVRAIVLQPDTKYQGVLKKNGESFLWLTDDDRRFLVRLEAKVKIGSVVGKLDKLELGTAPAQP